MRFLSPVGAVLRIGHRPVQIRQVEAASSNPNTDLQDPNLVQNSVTGFNRQLQEDGIKNHKSSTSRQADVLRRGHEGRNCELVDSLLTSSLTGVMRRHGNRNRSSRFCFHEGKIILPD